MLPKSLLLWPAVALASVTIEDPSDVIDPSWWAADNAIIPDYNIPFVEVQPSDSGFSFVEIVDDMQDTDTRSSCCNS
jgi:hypothetical protein